MGKKWFSGRLQNKKGELIGKWETWGRGPTPEEYRYIEAFTLGLFGRTTKRRIEKTTMAKTENCNMVFLAGTIKRIDINPNRAFLLIDCGMGKKFVPVTVYEDKEEKPILEKLERFDKEDFIQIKGYARPWSEKTDGGWLNHMDIAITEIKTEPPRRAPVARAAVNKKVGSTVAVDDDIPF